MSKNQISDHGRCRTGVEGMDEILAGGFPRNRLYLLRGDSGVGKTTFALQFLLQGVREGEPGLYITLSETRQELDEISKSHGWDLSPLHLFELSTLNEKLGSDREGTFFHPSEVELNRTVQVLLDEVDRLKPKRVVFDSLSELRMLTETPLRYRRQILHLKQYFAGRASTLLFLDDRSGNHADFQVESIAHGVIHIERSAPEYGIFRRRLNVQKIRGVAFREGNHDLVLRKGGMSVFPRLSASEHYSRFKAESFPSGIPNLDSLLGGGIDRGTSLMLLGPPGTSKSTLATRYAVTAAARGEKVLFFAFDEGIATLGDRAQKMGIDIKPHVESGMLLIEQINPAEISPGEFAHKIYSQVQKSAVRMVVIDSINGYLNAMPEERNLHLQLHELFAYLNQQGVITITILTQQGIVGSMHSAVDLTYLADTVVLLRYFEARGSVKQAISVIKKRSGNHERAIREIRPSNSGIQIGEPLTGLQGILTGVPSFTPGTEQPALDPS